MKEQTITIFGEVMAFLIMLFTGLTSTLIAVGILVMADTFTGVWSAVKEEGLEGFTSRKLGRIITKLILYPLAILVAKVAEIYLSPDIGWTYVTTSIIAVVEIKSIFENIGKILGFKLWDRLKKALWKDKEVDI